MLSTSNPAQEVSMHFSVSDCRLLVACVYIAQSVDSLGLSSDQANRAGQIVQAFHAAIFRSIRQSRDTPIS